MVGTKIFLGGLSWETTEEKLHEHFGKYGEIIEAVVMRDRQTGRPRGFGFVTFVETGLADIVSNDIHVIDGRQIDAKKSVPQEQKPKARKVFVGGISPETTEDGLKEHFGQFGQVAEVQIMQDHMSGRSRGFGFVTFEEDASAERAYAVGSMHDVGGKQVEVKPATPKGTGPTSGRPTMLSPAQRPPQQRFTDYTSTGPSGGRGSNPLVSPYGAPTGSPMQPPYFGMYAYPGMYPPAGGMQYPPNYMMMPPFSHNQSTPMGMPAMPPSSTMYGRPKSAGRTKVDSASSLEQQSSIERSMKKLSLEQ